MSPLFRFSRTLRRDPAIEAWMREHAGELGTIAEALTKLIEIAYADMKERVARDTMPRDSGEAEADG